MVPLTSWWQKLIKADEQKKIYNNVRNLQSWVEKPVSKNSMPKES